MQGIPPIEPLPKLYGHCKLLAILLTISIFLAPFLISAILWYIYNFTFFIGISVFIFFEIVFGMITSKLRVTSITPDQGEISYSTYEVATWYISRYFCPKKEEDNLLITDFKTKQNK